MNDTILEDYSNITDLEKFIQEGKNSANLRDFQDSKKVLHHMKNVYDLWKTGDTKPVHMTIGFTNYCQHKCPWCYINWQQSGRTSLRSGNGELKRKAINADDRLIEAVGEAVDMGLKAVTIVGDGEPTLHKKFINYIEKLKSMNLDIGLFTNMAFKKDEILEAIIQNVFFLRISLDSANKEYHDMTHGNNDFDNVIENIKKAVDLRKDKKFPIIGIQYVTNQDNYKDLANAAKLYKSLGVDYMTIKPQLKNELNPNHKDNTLKFKDAYKYMREAENFEDKNFKVYAKYSMFVEILGRTYNNGTYYKKCVATPLSPYLDEDGNVEMCGNLKGRGFTMGNIYKNSFYEIWNSNQRKSCLDKIDLKKCPVGCKLDPLNKTLTDLLKETKLGDSNKADGDYLRFQTEKKKKYKEVLESKKEKIHTNFI